MMISRKTRNIIIISAITVAALSATFAIGFSMKKENLVAVVQKDSVELTRLNLYEEWYERDLILQGSVTQMTLTVKKNAVKVKESGCPTQQCVQQGFIDHSGQTIVCAHNKVVITLEVYK